MSQQFLNDGNPTGADDRSEIERFGALTPRERQVLAEIMAGASNKEAGRKLGISHWEWLVNLEELLGKGEFQFFGVPLKFKGGSGSPVRAFAIINE